MDRKKLKIAEPCSERWDEMTGDEKRRFCDVCSKHVHNLSAMTSQEARALLAASKGEETPCITYAFGGDDKVVFADSKPAIPAKPSYTVFREVPAAQKKGLRRIIATAAFVPLLAMLPACDTSCPTEPPAIHESQQSTMLQEILDAEDRFVAELEELFGFTPEYEVVAGAPMEVDWEQFEEPEAEETPPPQPVTEPQTFEQALGFYVGDPAELEVMTGDYLGDPDELDMP